MSIIILAVVIFVVALFSSIFGIPILIKNYKFKNIHKIVDKYKFQFISEDSSLVMKYYKFYRDDSIEDKYKLDLTISGNYQGYNVKILFYAEFLGDEGKPNSFFTIFRFQDLILPFQLFLTRKGISKDQYFTSMKRFRNEINSRLKNKFIIKSDDHEKSINIFDPDFINLLLQKESKLLNIVILDNHEICLYYKNIRLNKFDNKLDYVIKIISTLFKLRKRLE
jgi:hypothetical protein